MRYAGWLVMVLGILFQVLVPLGIPGRPTGRWLSMPAEIAALFMATGTVVIGMVMVYLTWLRPYATRLDRSGKPMPPSPQPPDRVRGRLSPTRGEGGRRAGGKQRS